MRGCSGASPSSLRRILASRYREISPTSDSSSCPSSAGAVPPSARAGFGTLGLRCLSRSAAATAAARQAFGARWRSAGSLDVAYETSSRTWCPRTIRCTVCAARCIATTGSRRECTIAARSAGLRVVSVASLVSLASVAWPACVRHSLASLQVGASLLALLLTASARRATSKASCRQPAEDGRAGRRARRCTSAPRHGSSGAPRPRRSRRRACSLSPCAPKPRLEQTRLALNFRKGL